MKKLCLWSFLLSSVLACRKKNQSPEYLSFDAGGTSYYYQQGVITINTSNYHDEFSALAASPRSGTDVKFAIYGINKEKFFSTPGTITLEFLEEGFPKQDTIIIDGVHAKAKVHYLSGYKNYLANGEEQDKGQIIFTRRTTERLEGTFEFIAIDSTHNNMLHVTSGKFSIIPTP